MSWDWSGFGAGLGEGMAEFGKMGVRYALDSQLLQEKYALEKDQDEFRLRMAQQLKDEERGKMTGAIENARQGVTDEMTLNKAKQYYQFKKDGVPKEVTSWEGAADGEKERLTSDPRVALSKSEQMDATVMAAFRTGYLSAGDLAIYASKDDRTAMDWMYKMQLIQEKQADREQRAFDRASDRDLKKNMHRSVGALGAASARAELRAENRERDTMARGLYDNIEARRREYSKARDRDKVGIADQINADKTRLKALEESIRTDNPRSKSRPYLWSTVPDLPGSNPTGTSTGAGVPSNVVGEIDKTGKFKGR